MRNFIAELAFLGAGASLSFSDIMSTTMILACLDVYYCPY